MSRFCPAGDSIDLRNELVGWRPGLPDPALPSLAELPAFLADFGGRRLPVPAAVYKQSPSKALLVAVEPPEPLVIQMGALLLQKSVWDGAEESSQRVIGPAIMILVHTLFSILDSYAGAAPRLGFTLHRDAMPVHATVDPLLASSRPALLLVASQLLLLLGGERPGARRGAPDALQDVLPTMIGGLPPAHYGALPFILAYAAAGEVMQLHAVGRRGEVRVLLPM